MTGWGSQPTNRTFNFPSHFAISLIDLFSAVSDHVPIMIGERQFFYAVPGGTIIIRSRRFITSWRIHPFGFAVNYRGR